MIKGTRRVRAVCTPLKRVHAKFSEDEVFNCRIRIDTALDFNIRFISLFVYQVLSIIRISD